MKNARRAPYFCALFPSLCEIAQRLGYALCVHGSMNRDFDVVAVPWTTAAVPATELVAALMDGMALRVEPQNVDNTPRLRPHGRLAWVLHFDSQAYLDLSVLPRSERGCAVAADLNPT